MVEVYWRYIFFILGHGEKSLNEFIKNIKSFHPIAKLTADWSKEKVNFFDVDVTLQNGVLSTDLFVRSTYTHQFLDPTSCHSDHCKKDIPYSHRISFDNSNFDKRCNELESWLLEKDYSEKMIRKQVVV